MTEENASTGTGRGVLALTLYVLIGSLAGITWAPFSSTPKLSRQLFGMDDNDQSWQQNTTNILQAVFTPVAAWLLASSHRGLTTSIKLAAALLTVQCALFAAVEWIQGSHTHDWQQVLAVAGSAIGGTQAALFQGASTLLSARYFLDERSRARSTSIGYAGQYAGICAAQLWFRSVSTQTRLYTLLLTCLGLSGGLALVTIFVFPSPIQNSKSLNISSEDAVRQPLLSNPVVVQPFWSGVKHCFKSPSVLLLIVIGGVVQGSVFSWQSTLPMAFDGFDQSSNNMTLGYHFTGDDGNTMAFATIVAYTISSMISGDICERLFYKRHRAYLVLTLLLTAISVISLWIIIPSKFSPSNVASWLGLRNRNICYWSVFASVVSVGISSGLLTPPILELLAEISYPVPEGTTANAVMLLTELLCIPIPALIPIVPPGEELTVSTLVLMAALVLCFVLVIPVRAEYKRRNDTNKQFIGET